MGKLKFRGINARYVLCPARGEPPSPTRIYTSEKKGSPPFYFWTVRKAAPRLTRRRAVLFGDRLQIADYVPNRDDAGVWLAHLRMLRAVWRGLI